MIASFGYAEHALDCAARMQRAWSLYNSVARVPLPRIRIGIHTGPIVHAAPRIVGYSVILAVRLCNLAAPAQIVLSQATERSLSRRSGYRMVPLGARTLKGATESVMVLECVWHSKTMMSNPALQPRQVV
jgi:class 3 adenylate cyclase